jgi:hypothetical protein
MLVRPSPNFGNPIWFLKRGKKKIYTTQNTKQQSQGLEMKVTCLISAVSIVYFPMLRIRCIFDPEIRDRKKPDPGWKKNPDPGSAINMPDHFFQDLSNDYLG